MPPYFVVGRDLSPYMARDTTCGTMQRHLISPFAASFGYFRGFGRVQPPYLPVLLVAFRFVPLLGKHLSGYLFRHNNKYFLAEDRELESHSIPRTQCLANMSRALSSLSSKWRKGWDSNPQVAVRLLVFKTSSRPTGVNPSDSIQIINAIHKACITIIIPYAMKAVHRATL